MTSKAPTGLSSNGFVPILPEPWPVPIPNGDNCANGPCHEHEVSADGRQIKVWSSRYPENGFVVFDRDEWDKHIANVKAGKLDDTVAGVVTA